MNAGSRENAWHSRRSAPAPYKERWTQFWVLRLLALCLSACLLVGCYPRNACLAPRLEYTAKETEIRRRPSGFPPLTDQELGQPWASEYRVGVYFAKELDLYRAITSFKRARALISEKDRARIQELEYYIAYAYYLGHRYKEAIETFEQTSLHAVTPDFPTYRDLLIFLSDSYEQCGNETHAARLRTLLQCDSTQDGACLELSSAMRRGDLRRLSTIAESAPGSPLAAALLENYCLHRKSVGRAQTLSAIVPGAGYWYVGQKQSAITAFLLNALFIAAAYQFFHRGYYAAGAFVTSLEAGWYFGGICGSGEAAQCYNRILYEEMVRPALRERNLHPVLMIRFGF